MTAGLRSRLPVWPVAIVLAPGEHLRLTPHNLADATCRLCRATARRWIGRGVTYRCAGNLDAWKEDAEAAGDAVLACPACQGIYYLEPVRSSGGTAQWLLTAYRAATLPVRIGFIGFVIMAVLIGLSVAASAATVTDVATPTVVSVNGVSGDALLCLTVVGGLSLATSAASLVSAWHR